MGNPKEEEENAYSMTEPNINSIFTFCSLLPGGKLRVLPSLPPV